MNEFPDPQQTARAVGSTLLRFPSQAPATQQDFGNPRTVVFLHGFTANAGYMKKLADQFSGDGFVTLVFQYPSDRGIHHAARTLRELLETYDRQGAIARHRVVLVCHSMGGLVGRALIALEGGEKYVRKLVTLGTPHNGTLSSATLLHLMLKWSENLAGLNPNAFAPRSVSASELIRRDPAPHLIDRLRAPASHSSEVEFLSVAGGHSELEFGRGAVPNMVANRYIQRHLSVPNDGLVEESSSDLSRAVFRVCAPGCEHLNSYAEYPYTNHTNLINNQTVAAKVVAFACE